MYIAIYNMPKIKTSGSIYICISNLLAPGSTYIAIYDNMIIYMA